MSNSISIEFVKLSAHETPIIKEENSYDYIRFGKDNSYPQMLNELYHKASLHRSIIKKKVRMILAKGLTSESEASLEFLKNMSDYDRLEDFLDKTATDLELHNGFSWEVIWNNKGDKINKVNHIPVSDVRLGKEDEEGKIEKIFYKKDGIFKSYTKANEMEEYVPFSDANNKKEAQLLYSIKYEAGMYYYTLASYNGAITDIETQSEISKFHNANIKNGFAPSYIITFEGPEPSPAVKKKIVKKLKEKYSGAENSGAPVILFLDRKMASPKFELVASTDIDKQFEQLNKDIKEMIVNSHEIPRQVVGLESAGSLGNSKEILQASAMFQSDYIVPQQEFILSKLNMLLEFNGLEPVAFKNPSLSLLMFDIDLKEVLSTDEIRESLGFGKRKEALNEQ